MCEAFDFSGYLTYEDYVYLYTGVYHCLELVLSNRDVGKIGFGVLFGADAFDSGGADYT